MEKAKKLSAVALAIVLTFSSVQAMPIHAQTFSDVPTSHWAYRVIDDVSNQRLMVGYGDGIFGPNRQLTRAEYTAILFNLAPDRSYGENREVLWDTTWDKWYADAAQWGVSNHIIEPIVTSYTLNGMPNYDFVPNQVVTREYMAFMTYNFITMYYPDMLSYNDASYGYTDQTQISAWAQYHVNVLSNNGIISGKENNRFDPQGTLTRAEAAAMITRIQDIAENMPVDMSKPNTPLQPGESTHFNRPIPSIPDLPADALEAQYIEAMNLLEAGDSYEAFYAFNALGNYRDSVERKNDAFWLNMITMDWHEITYTGLMAGNWYTNYPQLTDQEIRNTITQNQWLSLSEQSFEYRKLTFYTNGTGISEAVPSNPWWGMQNIQWGVVNHGVAIYDSNGMPSYMQNNNNSIRKLTDNIYLRVSVPRDLTGIINPGPTGNVFVKADSALGQGYMNWYTRRADGALSGVPTKDENGLFYYASTNY